MPVKFRAKIKILNYFFNFLSIEDYDRDSISPNKQKKAWINCFNELPPVGSLVKLRAAPDTKWYLGWFIEYIPQDEKKVGRYLIESVEDGALCNWYNVSLAYLPLEITNNFPEWRWTDQQFEFADRWYKANTKSKSQYTFRPQQPVFNESGSVTLKVNPRWQITENTQSLSIEIPSWKKVTLKALVEIINNFIKQQEAIKVTG